jgi:hypothetical protein
VQVRRVCCAVLLVLSLTGCAAAPVVARVAAPLVVGVARILITKGGTITLRQAGKLALTTIGPVVTQAALDALLKKNKASAGTGGGGWTIVVKRKAQGKVESVVYRVAGKNKLYVFTNGRTMQTFQPGKDLVTIDAVSGTPTTVAVLDTLQQPVRSSGKFTLPNRGNDTSYDLDVDKRSKEVAGSDLHVDFWTGLAAVKGAVVAKVDGDKQPTLADCVTIRPDSWGTDFSSIYPQGQYCVQTSEGRFAALKVGLKDYTYTVWQTSPGTA